MSKKRKILPNGRVIRFRDIKAFLERNQGARAVAHQVGGTFSILAANGNCTTLFNSDNASVRQFVANDRPVFIPIR